MVFPFRTTRFALVAVMLAAMLSVQASADGHGVAAPASPKEKIIVAVREAPPFAFKNAAGQWVGITIELWQAIAKKLGYEYEYQPYGLESALTAIRTKRADVGVGAFSITADRVETMNFTHTYAPSGLGIATRPATGHFWTALFNVFFRWEFLRTLGILATILLVAGSLVWVFERRHNNEQFSKRPVEGLISGFWWSAVTMTTVGYGDKSPVTLGGRVVGLIWMFASIVIISGLTGSIAAALTLVQIVPIVSGPQDLAKAVVATVQDSTGDEYLQSKGIHPIYFDSVKDGLSAVDTGAADAFVADHAILSYRVAKSFAGKVEVLPQSFSPTFLALPMAPGSTRTRAVDIALLKFVETPAWDAILTKYNVIK